MEACRTCQALARTFLGRLRAALPTILFYILQFTLVVNFFGLQYALVLAGSTTLFQLRRKQRNDLRRYLQLFFVPLLLCLLAFAATRSAVLCVVLNFTVLLFLVLWKSSQFDPKGYLGFAMTFVFLELRPPAPEDLGMQVLVVAFCHALLLLALFVNARLTRPADPSLQIPAGLRQLSDLLERSTSPSMRPPRSSTAWGMTGAACCASPTPRPTATTFWAFSTNGPTTWSPTRAGRRAPPDPCSPRPSTPSPS